MRLPQPYYNCVLEDVRPIFIYTLSCPETNYIKYVGQSVVPLDRYGRHLRFNRGNCKSIAWIKSLKKKWLVPEMQIIDVVSIKEWRFWEQHYISLYRSWGFNLKNMTDGGEGTVGCKQSEESNRKRSIALTGKKKKITVDGIRRIKEAISVPIKDDSNGETFNSISEVVKKRGIAWGELIELILKNKLSKRGYKFKFINEKDYKRYANAYWAKRGITL